ncbi:MAG: ADOP family duplicated permease [Vicinamibacterales bacterium]
MTTPSGRDAGKLPQRERAQGKHNPPRVAEAWLRRVLPGGKRGLSMLGDLREEYHVIASERSARRWYWLQALRLTLRYKSLTEQAHRHKGSIMPHDLKSDLRTALRMFVRNPGTSTIIVFTLAVTIAAATIGFAFADLALFRGLPVDDPSRVVSIFASDTRGSNPRARVSGPDYLDYRERAKSLERVAVMRQGAAPLITDGQSSTLTVSYATADVFAAMGQTSGPLGRVLGPGDDVPGATPVVALSHRYWQEKFAGRADAVGRTLQIGREVFTIVGVVTPEMEFGNLAEIDVWLPLRLTPDMPRDVRNLRFVARLRHGVTFEHAAAEIAAIGDGLAAEYPDTNRGWRVRLIPIRDLTGGAGFWVVIALFMLSVGLLIAIATANVSNLVMVRAVSRQRELAVRTALGARRGRLVRQLMVEGLALSIAGAALSLPFAVAGLRLIAAVSSEPVFRQLRIDEHEFGFIASLALICPVLFTLAPARTIARTDTRQVLAAGAGRGTTASIRGRGALVVAQVALAVILLTASSLAVRGIVGLYSAPTGIQTSHVLLFTLDFDDMQYPDASLARAAAETTRNAVRTLPGVEQVAMMNAFPIIGSEGVVGLAVNQESQTPGDAKPTVVSTNTTAETASVLGITLLAGQWWNEGATDVAVVSRETAVRYLGGVEGGIGQSVALSGGSPVRIIGVASDVVSGDLTAGIPPRMWTPLPAGTRRLTFAVKAQGDPAALTGGVRTVVAKTAPAVPLENLKTLDEAFRLAAMSDYIIIGMLSGFAVLALVLAASGLFGVVSYAAAQRTAEFGTRMALGASAFDVIRLVARQSLVLLALGLGIGLLGGIGVGFGMRSALLEISPMDPLTIGGVAALLTVVTLAATAIPAWRAGRIDPITALRAE